MGLDAADSGKRTRSGNDDSQRHRELDQSDFVSGVFDFFWRDGGFCVGGGGDEGVRGQGIDGSEKAVGEFEDGFDGGVGEDGILSGSGFKSGFDIGEGFLGRERKQVIDEGESGLEGLEGGHFEFIGEEGMGEQDNQGGVSIGIGEVEDEG